MNVRRCAGRQTGPCCPAPGCHQTGAQCQCRGCCTVWRCWPPGGTGWRDMPGAAGCRIAAGRHHRIFIHPPASRVMPISDLRHFIQQDVVLREVRRACELRRGPGYGGPAVLLGGCSVFPCISPACNLFSDLARALVSAVFRVPTLAPPLTTTLMARRTK